MSFQKVITGLTIAIVALTIATIGADRPLERMGNEAAFEADSLYSINRHIEAARKYEEAYDYFVRAQEEDEIPLQDKIAQMVANMVTAYYQAQDFENAVRSIKKRLELEPRNDVYARQIAQIYERELNDADSAIKVLEEFDPRNPNFAVRRTLGRLYSAKEDTRNALRWYEAAFELRQDADVLQNIALLHYRAGNTESAIRAYENFIATDPPESVLVNVYRNMGKFYDDIGDDLKSIAYYENSNRIRFNRDITLLLLVKYFDRGDLLNAREKANQLLQDNPNNAHAIFHLGLILFEQERYSEAKAQFEKVRNDRTYGANARQYIESIDSM